MKWFWRILFVLLAGLGLLIASMWNNDLSLSALKGRYANEQSQFMPLNGMNVHYRIEGKGEPLVLIHGTASSLHTWDGWVKELKNDHQIIRMDIPGFGLTGPHPDRNYSIEAYVNFIDNFVNELGVDSFYLAGNSLGGEIAWNYTFKHQDKVKKMILIDAAGYPRETETPYVFKLAQIPVLNQLLLKATPRRLVEKSVNDVYWDETKVNDTLVNRYFELQLRPGNRQAFVDRVKVIKGDSYGNIKKIKTPTLIQWGRNDAWIPYSDGEKFASDLRNSKLVAYSQAGHVPMEEIPERTAIDAKMFLKGKIKTN